MTEDVLIKTTEWGTLHITEQSAELIEPDGQRRAVDKQQLLELLRQHQQNTIDTATLPKTTRGKE